MKAKSDKRKGKEQRIMSIVDEMSDAKLDALLLLLDVKPEKEYEFTEEENNLVAERIARYEKGESKGMLAEEASRKVRAKLQMIAKSGKRIGRVQRILSIVGAMSNAKLDALLLFLDVKPEKEYEFTEEENNLVAERIARYERGESKGMLAEEASRKIRAKLQKKRK